MFKFLFNCFSLKENQINNNNDKIIINTINKTKHFTSKQIRRQKRKNRYDSSNKKIF